MQPCDTVVKCPIPQVTLYHCITPKDDRVTTLYTPWTIPPVTVATNSSAHASIHLCMLSVPNSDAETLNILKLS